MSEIVTKFVVFGLKLTGKIRGRNNEFTKDHSYIADAISAKRAFGTNIYNNLRPKVTKVRGEFTQ